MTVLAVALGCAWLALLLLALVGPWPLDKLAGISASFVSFGFALALVLAVNRKAVQE